MTIISTYSFFDELTKIAAAPQRAAYTRAYGPPMVFTDEPLSERQAIIEMARGQMAEEGVDLEEELQKKMKAEQVQQSVDAGGLIGGTALGIGGMGAGALAGHKVHPKLTMPGAALGGVAGLAGGLGLGAHIGKSLAERRPAPSAGAVQQRLDQMASKYAELNKIAAATKAEADAAMAEIAETERQLYGTPEGVMGDTKFGRYLMQERPDFFAKPFSPKSGTTEGDEVMRHYKEWEQLPPEPLPPPAPMPSWAKKRGLFKRAELNDGPAEGLEEIEEAPPPHPAMTAGKTIGGVALGTGLGVGLGELANLGVKKLTKKPIPVAARYGIPVLGAAAGLGYSALQGSTMRKMKEDMEKRKELEGVGQAT